MEKKLRTFLIWFWLILGISLLLTILFFTITFRNSGLSSNPSNWGTFGDYFGGIIQSIIALANLIIFVKLTNLLAFYQKKHSDNELALQKKIVLTQLRSEAIRNISNKLNSFFEIIKDSNQKKLDLINLAGHVDSFCKHNNHLFSLLTENSQIAKTLLQIVKCYELSYASEDAKLEDIRTKMTTFYSERDNFIQPLQGQILDSIK